MRLLGYTCRELSGYEMKRAVGFFLLVASLSGNAVHAQFGTPSEHPPTIAVVGSADDARLGLVDDAVSFWNKTFHEIGSCFNLGPVTRLVQPIPEVALQSLGRSIEIRAPINIPPVLRDPPGDLTIFLGASEFVSFTTGRFGPNSKRVVGIRGLKFPPMTMPNVAGNVITHLLGLALGLRHNSDPTTLMCGRPAPCRPALFRSDEPRVFPLTDAERRQLLAMYSNCVA
jgi:hypothetical protein